MQSLFKHKKHKNKTKKMSSSIFVVDDDPSYLYLLGWHLKKNTDCKIYCYSTGEECLDNLNIEPSIVILDYFLNSENNDAINGLDVLKEIKKLKPAIPVIMLSGQKSLIVATNSLKYGAYTYVIKDKDAISSVKHVVNVLCNQKTDSF